jgi:NADPH:quinone reductase-like Zn-dependent oxidoreductase
MRAILRTGFGGPDVLVIREIAEPEPKDGHAEVQVKAFGLNHAELHMRKWGVGRDRRRQRRRVRRRRQVLPRR